MQLLIGVKERQCSSCWSEREDIYAIDLSGGGVSAVLDWRGKETMQLLIRVEEETVKLLIRVEEELEQLLILIERRQGSS